MSHWPSYHWAFFQCSDGKLREADQILAINGQPLDQTVTHQQAISILQSAAERVQLTVARGPIPQLASPVVSRTPSAASTVSANSNAVCKKKKNPQSLETCRVKPLIRKFCFRLSTRLMNISMFTTDFMRHYTNNYFPNIWQVATRGDYWNSQWRNRPWIWDRWRQDHWGYC